MLRFGDPNRPDPPVGSFLAAWYVFAIVVFACQQRLTWTHLQRQSTATSFEIPLMQVGFCGLVALFDFWIRPAWRLFYTAMFRDNLTLLPQPTKFILFSIPAGALTVIAVILWGLSVWSIVSRAEPSGTERKHWGTQLFSAFGLGLLLLIPLIVILPLLG